MTFKVIDKNTGKEANVCRIALKEEWAKDLMYCDMEGFAITQDGNLIHLLDECGRFAYCPENRFIVEVQNDRLEELKGYACKGIYKRNGRAGNMLSCDKCGCIIANNYVYCANCGRRIEK